jgi:hypothetical protein
MVSMRLSSSIVEVKSMPLEADFHPVMLFVNNRDKPEFIGALGALLGEGASTWPLSTWVGRPQVTM